MEHPIEPPELIGQSPIFLDALAHASNAAPLERSILIVGERGSGKELIAGRIHFLSRRWDGPLVKLNCAALSEDLLESELFGHEAGAFTGASKRHTGRFERAEGGTLFLDEIASASLRVQEKLLRVIEYGEYERVGGEKTLNANVRIIAAANVDLPALADKGDFRADLLDRLAFDVIEAPPLRARAEDIPVLAAHFGALMAKEIEARFEGFTPRAMATLLAYDWPGNVRELKNAAERSVYRWIADDNTGPVDDIVIDPFETNHRPPVKLSSAPAATRLPSDPKPPAEPPAQGYDFRKWLDSVEQAAVEKALMANGGNQRAAAAFLRLTYDQMRGLVRKYNLSR